MSRSNHISIDLHGESHKDAKVLIEEFIVKNIENLPLEVITGNSVDMLDILKKVVATHNLHLIPSHPANMGSYLITMPLYIE